MLAAFVAARGSVVDAAARIGIRPSTATSHMADLRARSGLSTEHLIYLGRAEGWLVVPSLELNQATRSTSETWRDQLRPSCLPPQRRAIR